MTVSLWCRAAIAAAFCLLFAFSPCLMRGAEARPAGPTQAPAARLIANIGQYIRENPADPRGWFARGRIRYFAFANKSETVSITRFNADGSGLPQPFTTTRPPGKGDTLQSGPRTGILAPADREHIRQAISDIRKAIALRDRQATAAKRAADNGLYELCLACVYDDAAPFAAQLGPPPGEPRAVRGASLTQRWQQMARDLYYTAFSRAIAADRAHTSQPIFGISTLISHEAGTSYLRLIGKKPATALSAAEGRQMAEVKQSLAALEKLPPGPITPVVFSLERKSATLAELLAPETRVSFDLDGTGRAGQRYSWVRPDTALLVWDPEETGQVTSGRQLFGSVTWWMFWENGYQALDALDDDRDGWLHGRELRGLALWRDRNGNGVSEPGEVVPVERTPVAAIATRATGREGQSWMNASGLRLRDGTVLPTYDWVVTPTPTERR